ncbi:MAG: amidohydrolase family protein [Bacilli bacterium]|nr:amidohydrolase family protein [Bacilli bacterium]
MKALVNVRIYDYEIYIESGYVLFDEVIHKVGEMKDFKNKGYEVIDGKGQLLMPNFVCAHSHIYSIFARGLSLPFNPNNFQEILDQMWWKIDSKIDSEITYHSGIAAGCEFLLNGVTTIIDHHACGEEIPFSLGALRQALDKTLHLRSILCFETSDRFPVDECIKENISFANKFHTHHVSGLFGMHASMSLSDETLKKVSRKLKDLPIHIHVAESEMDEEDSYAKYGISIMERLDKFGLVNKDSLIVHGVHISDKELDIVKARGAYMVVNTTSNLNNAVGIPDIKKFIDKGIPVMVGNDGLSSQMTTEYLNAMYLTHLKNNSPTALNIGHIKDMINNAYDYVGRRLDIKIGKISPDYVSDFLLVDYIPFTKMDSGNAFGHIFYGLFPNFKPTDVYVDGKRLVRNGQLVSKKAKEELIISREYSKELWRRVKE